ncbi:MAG: inorganic phosphate transporter [Salinivirgaceae bacterium]|jgi:phosphate/sulfate permease|nr:inorganic phosphate transporter [Salinivirgaceae bacterium]
MDIYLFFVIVLFGLAISDLIVGVSNDAVNFLVSAIGSKAAPFWIIMIVASLGIVVGATFSSGMMEVARKGIFHPGMFYFHEIMIIFLAVMLTDILLLDLFNTFGMPTSTTVSIVFELLGAAVAIAFLKVKGDDVGAVGDYINSGKALAIISGILLSVVVAFSVGALVQYITRMLFSFKTDRTIKFYGAIWGGLGITAITYFMLIKGLKGSSYASFEMSNGDTLHTYVKDNAKLILLYSFIIWAIVLQLLNWLFKTNILKVVVLAGTFALAMAFAGNDLVNFIGVPLAGLKSHEAWMASGLAADQYSMGALAEKVSTQTIYLLFAGAIMVGALIFSKKSRSVTKTSLDLSRQDEGAERFESSGLSRSIVRISMAMSNSFRSVVPNKMLAALDSRFEQVQNDQSKVEGAEFDLIRASVNLMVASILISFATSLKLPLSTTYVTFMVAMGTSLADGAWGRESAVYRITGVMSVIGGWFLTAFVAFSAAFIMALIISWGGVYAVIGILLMVIYLVYRSSVSHKKKAAIAEEDETVDEIEKESTVQALMLKCNSGISQIFTMAPSIIEHTFTGFIGEKRKELKKQVNAASEINLKIKKQKDKLYKVIGKLQQDSAETGHYYVQVTDYQRELARSLSFLTTPLFDHVDNNHKTIIGVQVQELHELAQAFKTFFAELKSVVEKADFEKLDEIIENHLGMFNLIEKYRKNQVKRIKQQEVGTRNSMLYLNILAELRNVLLYSINIVKAERDFVKHSNTVE